MDVRGVLLVFAILGSQTSCCAFVVTLSKAFSFFAPPKLVQHKLKTVFMLGNTQNEDFGKDSQDMLGIKSSAQDPSAYIESLKAMIAMKDAELAKVIQKVEINPWVLMTSPVPAFEDMSSLSSAPSRSVDRVDVRNVSYFSDFRANQKAFTLSIRKELQERSSVDNYWPPTSTNGRTAGCELDIEKILYATTFFALNRLLDDVETSSPAQAQFSINADSVSYLKKSSTALVLYEVKRRNLVSCGTDLVKNCRIKMNDRDNKIVSLDSLDAVQKLAGYMSLAKVQYGILTTGLYYWAVQLLESGPVLISEPYQCKDEGENSVLSMLYYVIHLAREAVKSGKQFTPPSLNKVADPTIKGSGGNLGSKRGHASTGASADNDGTGGGAVPGTSPAAIPIEDLTSWPDVFRCLRILEDHPDRVTFQAQIGGAGAGLRLVAVKAFERTEARNAEARLLRRLKPLQVSGAIPALLDGELELEWTDAEERRVHALMMAWVGPPDAGGRGWSRPSPPAAALRRARSVLEEMHALGVAHGDVRLPNLSYDPVAGRVFVLDLSHGVARGEADFGVRCAEDLHEMDRLIAAAEGEVS